MDGAAPATPNIDAGQDFTYRFSAPNSGTYWGHPHVGLEEDMGLYLPVIIDDPHESSYDAEWIVVMDDWTDGVGKSPQQLYDELTAPKSSGPAATPSSSATSNTSPTSTTGTTDTSGTTGTTPSAGMPGMLQIQGGSVGTSDLLGGDAGDIGYPYYLINGRIPSAPNIFN